MNSKRIVVYLLGISLLLLAGCNWTGISSLIPAPQANVQVPLMMDNTTATTTRTPFQPLGPTATPTITNTPENTATPTYTPTVPTPTTNGSYYENKSPTGTINIMVLGNDYRPSSGYRTDVMVLVSIDTQQNIVNAISFPRDLYVDIPGRGLNRLNTAMPFGGFALLQQTMEYNFHVHPDYYIMTNFQGFANIINSLGGIEVNCARNLYDTCDLPQAVNGYCSAGPGLVSMNGETALWYVRSRYSTNDFDRNRRQQEVLYAILKKFTSFDVITRAGELYDAYRGTVETDLDLGTILNLITVVPSLNQAGHLNQYYIDSTMTTGYITEGGAMVLLPNQAAIESLIRRVIYQE